MRHGFTLIELLIVVAIIAILAAIAVPNFLEAQTRSKVVRMQNDLRTLAQAIELYRVDEGQYPRIGPPGTCQMASSGVAELTTPIAYLNPYPLDSFRLEDGRFQPMYYSICNYGTAYCDLWSWGPDLENQFGQLVYDPTNGTISPGDIHRTLGAKPQ